MTLREKIALEICLYCGKEVDNYGSTYDCSLQTEDKPCKAALTTSGTILHLFAEWLRGKGKEHGYPLRSIIERMARELEGEC